jgi:hypothetical protein
LDVIEPRRSAPGPANLAGIQAEMLDVALLAGLPPVLQPVQALPRRDARAQIAVALQARALIDALAGAMAVAAVGVSFERRVRSRQRAWRQQLRPGGTREQGDSEGQQGASRLGKAAPHHRSKIHRNP